MSAAYFFSEAAARAIFQAEWPGWLNTPFREHSQAKGLRGGVYCVGLCEAILSTCGAIAPCSFPHDESDYQSHKAESKILEYLRGAVPNETSAYLASRFAELPVEEGEPVTPLMHGDLLLGSFYGFFHLPLITDPATGQFLHAIKPRVAEGRLSDSTYAGRTIAHFRARAL